MELVAVVEVGGMVDRVNDNPRRTRGGSDLPTWQLVLEVSLNTYMFKCLLERVYGFYLLARM